MSKLTNNLHPFVTKQVSFIRHLAKNNRETADVLDSIADTAIRMNYLTPSMKRVVTINADAVKFAIRAISQQEK